MPSWIGHLRSVGGRFSQAAVASRLDPRRLEPRRLVCH